MKSNKMILLCKKEKENLVNMVFFHNFATNFTLILCVFIPEYVKYQKITY